MSDSIYERVFKCLDEHFELPVFDSDQGIIIIFGEEVEAEGGRPVYAVRVDDARVEVS